MLTEEIRETHINEDPSQESLIKQVSEDSLPQDLPTESQSEECFNKVPFKRSQSQTCHIEDVSMLTHKEVDKEVAWEFVEPISSLATHRLLLPPDDAESGQSCSMVAHSINLIQEEDTKPEKVDFAEPEEVWTSMVGHHVVGTEESDLPFASMAAHCSFVPEWKEEGIVSSGVSHQLLNQCEREEENVPKQNVSEKWAENAQEDEVFEPLVSLPNQIPGAERYQDGSLPSGQLPYIPEVEEPSTDVKEAEDSNIRKEAEIDPRRRNIELASSSALPKSPVGTSSDDEKDSFENFINESKQTYHERVADEYKSTIKRIQDLHKLVEEEIGEFEKSRKDVRKSEVITVMR